jgi:hypothetical protein
MKVFSKGKGKGGGGKGGFNKGDSEGYDMYKGSQGNVNKGTGRWGDSDGKGGVYSGKGAKAVFSTALSTAKRSTSATSWIVTRSGSGGGKGKQGHI